MFYLSIFPELFIHIKDIHDGYFYFAVGVRLFVRLFGDVSNTICCSRDTISCHFSIFAGVIIRARVISPVIPVQNYLEPAWYQCGSFLGFSNGDKQHDQSNLGKKEFISSYTCTWQASQARTKAGQKPWSRNKYIDHRGVLLIGLLLITCSASFSHST